MEDGEGVNVLGAFLAAYSSHLSGPGAPRTKTSSVARESNQGLQRNYGIQYSFNSLNC